jgi:hypothetical protein
MEYQMYMIGWSFNLFLHWLETQVNQHFKILAIVDKLGLTLGEVHIAF